MNTNAIAHMKSKERNIGIDVGKTHLDICIYELDRYWQVENNREGIRALLATLGRYNVTRVLAETTGVYERQLVESSAQELNWQHKSLKVLEASHNRLLKVLDKEIAWINAKLEHEVTQIAEIEAHLTNHQLSARDRRRRCVYAIGGISGTGANRQIAALCGLAPFNKDSGTMRGKRRIRGGRAPIRTVLFMAMLSAIQHNPIMRDFYQGLVALGKKRSPSLRACEKW
jgi:transposase